MKTLYLHIGTPKTGTTSIQSFMQENNEVLNRYGYCYPPSLENDFKRRNGHFLLYFREKQENVQRKEALEAGFAQLKELFTLYPNIVLSDEDIYRHFISHPLKWEALKERLAEIGCQLKLIVYLRRQDQFVQSLWNQKVKSATRLQEDFKSSIEFGKLKNYPFDYARALALIASYVGKENIIVRVYERGQFEGTDHTLQSDFLQSIGLSLNEEYSKAELRPNLSLNYNYTYIKRICNTIPELESLDDDIREAMRKCSEYKQRQSMADIQLSLFPNGGQGGMEYLKQFQQGNESVAREYLHREDGKLFSLKEEDSVEWEFEPEKMYEDFVLLFMEMLCRQQETLMQLRSQNKYMRKQHEEQNSLKKKEENSFLKKAMKKIKK